MNPLAVYPQAPGALPAVGHAIPLFRKPLEFLRSLPALGDVVRIRVGSRPVLMVCDPELTRQVLLHDRTFDKGGPFYDKVRECGGNGLATCPSSEHRRQRRLMQPAFHQSRLPAYASLMSEQIATVVDTWQDGQLIDVAAEMQKITNGVLISALFSSALSQEALAEFERHRAVFIKGLYRGMVLPAVLTRLPTPVNRGYQLARDRTRQILADAIAERRATSGDDLLSLLLHTRDTEDGSGMSETELIDQVMTMFGAGTETTTSALAWALHLISCDAAVAASVFEEVSDVLSGQTAKWEDLPQLTRTHDVLMEALRIYPPLWMIMRSTSSDADLGDRAVPAGTIVAYSPYILGHSARYYDRPEEFLPDRWSAGGTKASANPAFVAFGGGARKCIGDEFGIAEAVLVLATVLRRWRLGAQPGTGHHPRAGLTLSPKALMLQLSGW